MKNPQIEWCDHMWRPWRGGPLSRTSLVATKNWSEPVKWNKRAVGNFIKDARRFISGRKDKLPRVDHQKVFPSLCDWLDQEVPAEWLARFLGLIAATPNLDWLLLTKRPELWRERMAQVTAYNASGPWTNEEADIRDAATCWIEHGIAPENVWVGVSVEDQPRANERIQELLKIPAKLRFLIVEPLLGPLDLTEVDSGRTESMRGYERRVKDNALRDRTAWGEPHRGLNWVIVGGESGPKARPCNVEWIRDIVRQCRVAKVPCYVKQLGSAPEFDWKLNGNSIARYSCKTHWGITHPKGGDPAEWPEDIRVRQIPEVLR